ncbi:MAG TPA: hypothetical protein VFO83_16145 [Aggregicoccus sp.]|nr:hypothetical protein [Aggregicoccus sp.]
MAPWLLLSLTLAQSPDPAASAEAQRTQEEALRRQGEAQSMDGTLDGGTSSTGAPDPSLTGTGGSGAALPGGTDAGMGGAGVGGAGAPDGGSPYSVPSPFPGTGGAGDAGDPRFAPGTGSSAPGSTGPTPSPSPSPGGADAGSRRPLDTGGADTQAAAGGEAAVEQEAEGTVAMPEEELEGPPSAATPEEATAALRAQVQALQEREQALTQQQQQLTEQTEALQAQLAEAQERAQALEAARAERLAALEDVSGLLVSADTALAVGEGDVEAQVNEALAALAQVAGSAEDSGQGDTVLVTERALQNLSFVTDAVQRRDFYAARLALQAAAESVRGARRDSLEQTNGALLQEGAGPAAPAPGSGEAPLTQPGY